MTSIRVEYPVRDWLHGTAGVLAGLAAFAAMAWSAAAQERPGPPAAPANVVAAKAYGALERNCARCHQTGLLEGSEAASGIANLLALDEVARDSSLVRPGLPDASRLYTVALTREQHHDAFNDPAVAEPTASEIQAIRDWILELPVRDAQGCSARQRISPATIADEIEHAVSAMGSARARQTRFLSLAHLHNACATEAELDALRAGVADMLARLAPAGSPPPEGGWAPTIDKHRLVIAVSLSALGWRAAQWQELAGFQSRELPLGERSGPSAAITPTHQWLSENLVWATSPAVRAATGSRFAVVPADWFASRHRHRLSGAADAGSAPLLWGLPRALALAHAWERPADLPRAAADLGVTPAELHKGLAVAGDKLALPVKQLLSGAGVRRAALVQVYNALSNSPFDQLWDITQTDRLDLALAADKTIYKAGEVASFTVVATRDCYLTLIGIDRAGRATVLFPNELATDNRIGAARAVQVPAKGAPYRFRFKDRGQETIVAICSQTHKSPRGIAHDYERLRFTVLGDWQLFLREPPEMKEARRDDAATDIPRPLPSQRRRGRPAEPREAPALSGPDVQTRTAISIKIE